MKPRALAPIAAMASIAVMALVVAADAGAQQPAATFAAPNLTDEGARALAFNCAPCHGTQGRTAAGSTVPGLAGRPAADIATAMQEFRDGKRQATLMHQIAKGYSDPEIAAIARYFSSQGHPGEKP